MEALVLNVKLYFIDLLKVNKSVSGFRSKSKLILFVKKVHPLLRLKIDLIDRIAKQFRLSHSEVQYQFITIKMNKIFLKKN